MINTTSEGLTSRKSFIFLSILSFISKCNLNLFNLGALTVRENVVLFENKNKILTLENIFDALEKK